MSELAHDKGYAELPGALEFSPYLQSAGFWHRVKVHAAKIHR